MNEIKCIHIYKGRKTQGENIWRCGEKSMSLELCSLFLAL